MDGNLVVRSPSFCPDRLLVRAATSAAARPIQCTAVADAKSLRNQCIQFRPCIDIHKGKVKQIVGSTLCDQPGKAENLVTNFETEKSAAEYAQLYQNDGLFGGHVIMLGADEASQTSALKAVNAFPGGLQVGGGVTPNNAITYLDNGASHVIVTSFIFTDGKLDFEKLKELVQVVGKNRLVVDLSCRRIRQGGDYAVVTHRWQKFTDFILSREALESLSQYADEFLVHGVDVEGKRLGVDEELVSILGQWSPIPVTYAGGVSSVADLELIRVAGSGVVNVTVGSALDIFGGELPYATVVQWHKQHERNQVTT
eukprot:c22760_g1_i1 orf=167-1102(+)